MKIGRNQVDLSKSVYLIAEIGSNHNQDKNRALEMIDMAAEAGADAVKFQSILFDKIYQPQYEKKEFREWFSQIELDESWCVDLANRAAQKGVDFISAPTYVEAVDLLEDNHVPAYKIASPQTQGNHDIVRRVAQTGKPVIMSLGYSEYSDISDAVKIVHNEGNKDVVLLHCVSKYPMKPQEANLKFIQTLRQMTGCYVGFSDHSLDDHVTLAAVAMGACVIEKHVTIDRNMPGPDHNFAMTFSEFGVMAKRIHEVKMAIGDGVRMNLLDEEYMHRSKVARKLFSKKAIKSGENVDKNNTIYLRHNGEGGISESLQSCVDHCVAKCDIDKGALITWDSLELI